MKIRSYYDSIDGKYSAMDIIWMHNLCFAVGNAFKYLVRAGKKSPETYKDLNKALDYLNEFIVSPYSHEVIPGKYNVNVSKMFDVDDKLNEIIILICDTTNFLYHGQIRKAKQLLEDYIQCAA